MPLDQQILPRPGYIHHPGELYDKLGHILDLSISEIIGNPDLDRRQRIDAGDIQTLCFDELISEVAAAYTNLQFPGIPLLPEALQSIQDRISGTLKSSYNEIILAWVQPQESSSRQQRPSSPPGDFGQSTMSEDNQCPICYDNIAAKGFTQCEHKVCPPCLEKLVAAATTISGVSCPLCRQGYPKDVGTVETSKRLENLLPQQGAHTYHHEIPPGPRGGQTHHQYVPYASSYYLHGNSRHRSRLASPAWIQDRPQPPTWPRGSREVHSYPPAAHRHSGSPDSRLERHTVSQPPIAHTIPRILPSTQPQRQRHFMHRPWERSSGLGEELPDWVHEMDRDFSMGHGFDMDHE